MTRTAGERYDAVIANRGVIQLGNAGLLRNRKTSSEDSRDLIVGDDATADLKSGDGRYQQSSAPRQANSLRHSPLVAVWRF